MKEDYCTVHGPAITATGSGSSDTSKVLLRKQSAESLSNLWEQGRVLRRWQIKQKEGGISMDKLFNLDENDGGSSLARSYNGDTPKFINSLRELSAWVHVGLSLVNL